MVLRISGDRFMKRNLPRRAKRFGRHDLVQLVLDISFGAGDERPTVLRPFFLTPGVAMLEIGILVERLTLVRMHVALRSWSRTFVDSGHSRGKHEKSGVRTSH